MAFLACCASSCTSDGEGEQTDTDDGACAEEEIPIGWDESLPGSSESVGDQIGTFAVEYSAAWEWHMMPADQVYGAPKPGFTQAFVAVEWSRELTWEDAPGEFGCEHVVSGVADILVQTDDGVLDTSLPGTFTWRVGSPYAKPVRIVADGAAFLEAAGIEPGPAITSDPDARTQVVFSLYSDPEKAVTGSALILFGDSLILRVATWEGGALE